MPQILIAILIIIIIIIIPNIKIVPQSKCYVIERLGSYHTTWQHGPHFKIPFIDAISNKVTLKEIVKDFAPQPVITKDNVTMQIDTVVYYQITDPKLYAYGVERPVNAIENLTATTLRNIVGELELDETLTSRDTVNAKMREILDVATDPWGIKINRVELKNIDPPKSIREAMEKQMRAERERRESILLAEGEKQAQILRAEGEKQAQILKAEADKEANVLRAEGEKQALIAEAEGKSQAIKKIVEANPNAAYVTLQGYEALKDLAKGEATKIIVPSELANVSGLLTSVAETINVKTKK